MKTVVPMRRPNSSPHKYNNHSGLIREFEFPIGVAASVLSWIILAMYFGVIILGVFAVVSLTGIGIGSFRHSRPTSLVQSVVPTSEFQFSEEQEQIRKAA